MKHQALAEAREVGSASLTVTPANAARAGLKINEDGHRRSLAQLLSYPDIGWAEVEGLWPQLESLAAGRA